MSVWLSARKGNGYLPAGAGEKTASGINCHVLVTFVFEHTGRGVHARPSLELPQALTARGIQGG